MYKKILLININFIFLFFVSMACADLPLRITHKTDYGERLIGSVDLQFETITWVGSWTPDYVHLAGFDPAFGFTGDALYNDFTVNYPDNRWRMGSLIDAGIKRPVPNDQSLGFWFAPDREGKITTTSYTYQWNSQSNQNNLDRVAYFYTGIGLVDDVLNPDIVLDVTTLSDSNGDNKIDLGMHDEVSFEIMASSLNPDVEHIMVILDVWEQNGCIGENVSFEENVDTENSFEYNDYLHYIVGYDPDKTYTRSCIRQHVFIVSAGKIFRVKVKNLRATAKDAFATYNFYVRGHYNAANETLWADSHALFELTADYGSSSDTDSDGDGIADSIDLCPYDPQDNCNIPVDSDGDGIADSIDPCPYDPQNNCNTPVDSDGDGIADSIDLCPNDATNSCNTPVDSDGDGIVDTEDNCKYYYDPTNSCNAPVDSDEIRVRLMWPKDKDLLYLREGDGLDVSTLGGCVLTNWDDSCVDNIIRNMNTAADGIGEVALRNYDNKSVQYLSENVIETFLSENNGYLLEEKLENSHKEYFSLTIDWAVVDALMEENGLQPGDYKYWIRATYQGKFYYLEKVSRNWFLVDASDFDSFFYENNFDAISKNLFASLPGTSSYDTFQVPDIFLKDDLEEIKIEYGVIPWDTSYTPSRPRPIDYNQFKNNYSFVLYHQEEESGNGNIYEQITYDAATGILSFQYPEPDANEVLNDEILKSICFRVVSSGGASLKPISLHLLNLIRSSMADEAILSEYFNNQRESAIELNLAALFPPGDYLVQVIESSAGDCSNENFEDVQSGLFVHIPAYPKYNSNTGVLTFHYAAHATDEQLRDDLGSLCFEILRVTEDGEEEVIVPYLPLLEWKGLIDSMFGPNGIEMFGYNETAMWFDLSGFPEIFPSGNYVVKMSEGEGCATQIGAIEIGVSNL